MSLEASPIVRAPHVRVRRLHLLFFCGIYFHALHGWCISLLYVDFCVCLKTRGSEFFEHTRALWLIVCCSFCLDWTYTVCRTQFLCEYGRVDGAARYSVSRPHCCLLSVLLNTFFFTLLAGMTFREQTL